MSELNNMHILKFSYGLYNFLLACKFLEVLPKKFVKFILFSNDIQKKRFFWERLGVFSCLPISHEKNRWFWIHANAIGEVNASEALIRLIKDKYPTTKILLTVANFSADERAKQFDFIDKVLFFPYDIPFIVNRFIKIFRPVCVIILECDVWPNFVKICKSKKIPVIVASATYSNDNKRSLRFRYFYRDKFILSKEVFKDIDCFCLQSEGDAKRLAEVIPEHKNIKVTGNLKFSCLNENLAIQEKQYYQKLFNVNDFNVMFVAGNVHLGEVDILLDAFEIIRKKLQGMIMVLAPRFTEDVGDIERLLKSRAISYIKKTDISKQKRGKEDIILLDTMGELYKVYSIARVAFVGGSLVYFGDQFGGHNILEPAALNVPVLFGPYMHNFQNLADLFCDRGGGLRINNAAELADGALGVITEQQKAQGIVNNAMKIIQENKGVAENTFSFINDRLERIHNA